MSESTSPNSPLASPAVRAAQTAVQAMIAAGVKDLVLCPGSRSAPLAYAAAAAEHAGQLRVHVRIDERSAAFLALGLALGGGRPAAIATTSGTAVANLHPAVLEAHHSHVPLVIVTADRPHELRGTGANQTTNQVGIFGDATRWSADVPAPYGAAHEAADVSSLVAKAVAAASGLSGSPGPVHLNMAFREPLVPSSPGGADTIAMVAESWPSHDARAAMSPSPTVYLPSTPTGIWQVANSHLVAVGLSDVVEQPHTVVVAGTGAGPLAAQLATAQSWPLLAEITAAVGPSDTLVPAYRTVLTHASDLVADITQVIVLGRPTLSREVANLLANPAHRIVMVRDPSAGATPLWSDPARAASAVLPGVPVGWLATPDPMGSGSLVMLAERKRWLSAWVGQGAHDADELGQELSVAGRPLDGLQVAQAVLDASGPADALFVGASSAIRDLDAVSRSAALPHILSNRGLSGIDGTVSTALGVALSRTSAGRTRALMGDLTFLHDANGLLRGADEPGVDLHLIVLNDHGGSIFGGLEHGSVSATGPVSAAAMRRFFTTPHAVDIAALCRAFGVVHRSVTDLEALHVALAATDPGVTVIEVALGSPARTS